jgi:hypothetical protein
MSWWFRWDIRISVLNAISVLDIKYALWWIVVKFVLKCVKMDVNSYCEKKLILHWVNLVKLVKKKIILYQINLWKSCKLARIYMYLRVYLFLLQFVNLSLKVQVFFYPYFFAYMSKQTTFPNFYHLNLQLIWSSGEVSNIFYHLKKNLMILEMNIAMK